MFQNPKFRVLGPEREMHAAQPVSCQLSTFQVFTMWNREGLGNLCFRNPLELPILLLHSAMLHGPDRSEREIISGVSVHQLDGVGLGGSTAPI